MKKLIALLGLSLSLAGCADLSTQEKTINLNLTGEMLFSGANTLQMPVATSAESLAQEVNVVANNLSAIGVGKAIIELTGDQAAITESLLLQIVSNNQEMTTLGTLSPLPNGTKFELRLAEEIDLLPYLNDEGATWVLDLNLTEDFLDEMQVKGKLALTIKYSN
jgi:hypothetical protein